MSKGIGGACRKVLEDEKIVLYEYSSYNLNEKKYRNDEHIFDGIIKIQRTSLIEVKVHWKLNQLVTKCICQDIPIEILLSNGDITIKNCSNCWQISDEGYDFIALHFCYYILRKYQSDGQLPELLSYDI
ncbi:hypothetical protein [Clostridium butyricum]|uniref:hypothetical protein n=1 Tax=Clostridium butyricum TaxID=1492 RepID=UPI000429F7A9|nr:hypothetical protein [Clostridium butyricum]